MMGKMKVGYCVKQIILDNPMSLGLIYGTK
jgi:hypothetical protein